MRCSNLSKRNDPCELVHSCIEPIIDRRVMRTIFIQQNHMKRICEFLKMSPKLLHDQIALEGNAASYYLSVASWCKINSYDGAASFFRSQSDEERGHMLKIVQYLKV